jgi:hypothetical protein
MSNITTPGAEDLELTEKTILGCNVMLELLKHEGSTIDLATSLALLFLTGERFLPKVMIICSEGDVSCVFAELTKKDRDERQIIIGSPGVGKNTLLFLVALSRALTESTPCCFIRKTRYIRELTSGFFLKKTSAEAGTLTAYYNRSVKRGTTPETILEEMLRRLL